MKLKPFASRLFHPYPLNNWAPNPPSKYWKGALQLTLSNYTYTSTDANFTGEVLVDFENDFGDWKPHGKAFQKPKLKGSIDMGSVTGYSGVGWASSLNKDPKNSVGSLRSPKIKVEHRFLNFSVGGVRSTK